MPALSPFAALVLGGLLSALGYSSPRTKAVETGVRQFRALAPLGAWGLMALSTERIPNRGFLDDAIDQYRAVVATTGFFDAAVAESAAFGGSLDQPHRVAEAIRQVVHDVHR